MSYTDRTITTLTTRAANECYPRITLDDTVSSRENFLALDDEDKFRMYSALATVCSNEMYEAENDKYDHDAARETVTSIGKFLAEVADGGFGQPTMCGDYENILAEFAKRIAPYGMEDMTPLWRKFFLASDRRKDFLVSFVVRARDAYTARDLSWGVAREHSEFSAPAGDYGPVFTATLAEASEVLEDVEVNDAF